ncbi:MAG: ABC transporter permease subunit [Treponema sp.]|jgi:putative aldouronate transport system permease protein|nr:ABC transporter permease subunit [Treponema sp.]
MSGSHSVVRNKRLRMILLNYELYLFLLPIIVLSILFKYVPMYGLQIAFKNFIPSRGIWGSSWTGLENFARFFRSSLSWIYIKNTFFISLYSLVAGFLPPIILALLLNSLRNQKYKRVLQTVTYLPHFISVVVMAGMIVLFLSPRGLWGNIAGFLGVEKLNIMALTGTFKHVYVWSGVWQSMGWGSIIYLSALSAVDVELYEAATIDGANKIQKIWYIDIPTIAPTIIILLILNTGGLLSVGFQKAYLLQNNLNLMESEVIATYTYKMGLINAQYSFGAAVGLMNTSVNFIILIVVNRIARAVTNMSIW